MATTLQSHPPKINGCIAPVTNGRTLVEIAPGQRVVRLQHDDADRILISDLLPTGGGTYQAVARLHSTWVGMGESDLKKVGIIVSRQTLRRLMLGGFIRFSQPAPNRYQFDLESYLQHERDTEDPEFWTRNNGENRKRYTQGWQGTGYDRQDLADGLDRIAAGRADARGTGNALLGPGEARRKAV